MISLVDLGLAFVGLGLFWIAVIVAGELLPSAAIDTTSRPSTRTPWRQLANVIAQATPGRVIALTAIPIALVTAAGSVAVALDIDENLVRVNAERSFAVALSGALLFGAGAVAF